LPETPLADPPLYSVTSSVGSIPPYTGLEFTIDESPTRAKPSPAPPKSDERDGSATRNDKRDKFCYEQRRKGRSLKDIMAAVNKRRSWEPIATPQGVSQAAKRYALAKKLPWPLNTR
jgi:hypothetical protein